jgi:hypothetical protein
MPIEDVVPPLHAAVGSPRGGFFISISISTLESLFVAHFSNAQSSRSIVTTGIMIVLSKGRVVGTFDSMVPMVRSGRRRTQPLKGSTSITSGLKMYATSGLYQISIALSRSAGLVRVSRSDDQIAAALGPGRGEGRRPRFRPHFRPRLQIFAHAGTTTSTGGS